MTRGHWPSHRGGFTLIELLVVISILATLAALTVGIIGSVRGGQQRATTETTVKKIQVQLNQQLMTTVEEANSAKSQYVPLLVPFCDGDQDRAKSLVAYLQTKRDFSQTFAEAKNPLTLPGVGAIPGHKVFSQLPSGTAMPADQQSAVLLYLIVTGKGSKGTSTTDDAFGGATGKISFNGVDYPVFMDAYGTHIAFFRWFQSAETNNPPYVNGNDAVRDPYDRAGKLFGWSNATNRAAALTVLNSPAGSPAVNFDGANKVLTAVSAGPDKTFGTGDDVFGYKLAQFGGKSN